MLGHNLCMYIPTENSISTDGAHTLAESLKQNMTLTELNLEGKIIAS